MSQCKESDSHKDQDGLKRVLHGQQKKVSIIESGIQELQESNKSESNRLDDLLARTELLCEHLDVSAENCRGPVDSKDSYANTKDIQSQPVLEISWNDLVDEYASEEPVDLDSLLPANIAQQLDIAMESPLKREKWVRWRDFYVVAAAGLAGAVFDLLLSNKVFFNPNIHNSIAHSKHAIDFPVGGGNAHRTIGAGHDMLRFFEARKMLIEGKFEAVFRDNNIFSQAYKYAGQEIPYAKIPEEAATNALIMHWVADFFSARSLPIPGWSYLTEHDGRMADFALQSFHNGMNLRGLLSNMSGVLLTGTILRLYFYISQYAENRKVQWLLHSNVKYQEMALAAQSMNLIVNAGKVAITKNVFAINVPVIVAVVRHLIPVLNDIRRRRLLSNIVDRNQQIIDANWDRLELMIADEASSLPSVKQLLEGPVIEL